MLITSHGVDSRNGGNLHIITVETEACYIYLNTYSLTMLSILNARLCMNK